MDNQERKRIELKPVPLKTDQKLASIEVQTKPQTKRDILSDDEISEGFSKGEPIPKNKPKQDNTTKEEQQQARRNKRNTSKIGKYPSFEFELDEEIVSKLNQIPKEFRSIETMLITMETELKGLDAFLKENPSMLRVMSDFVFRTKSKFEAIKKQRIQQVQRQTIQENAQVIEYQRPDRDHFEMRKNETIHGLIREVETKWAKKIEIETKGFSNRSYEQYLELLKQKVTKEVQSFDFQQKKGAIENITRKICQPNRLKYDEFKAYVDYLIKQDETRLDKLAMMTKKAFKAKAHIKRVQIKLKKYMDLKQSAEFGSKVASYLWSPSDYYVQFG